MRRFESLRLFELCVIAIVVLSSGCSARSLTRQEYVLRGVVPAGLPSPVLETGGPTVSVGPVELPLYLQRPQIVTRVDANRVRSTESHVWAEDLSRSIARAVLTNITVLLPTDRAWLFPGLGSGVPDYRVLIRVDELAGNAGGEVVLDAQWSITAADASTVPASRRTRLTRPSQVDDYGAIVEAMVELVGEMSREIADELRTLTRPAAGHS